MTTLSEKTCIPCKGGVPPISQSAIELFLRELPEWRVVDDHHLEKRFKFKNFLDALSFVNEIGAIAEEQQHHPNISFTWGQVTVQIWTHKIDNMTESDFILAARIEEIDSLVIAAKTDE
ncbi:MAG: 4a-hydroxytetrahydrobiopterin dehydratase [bacterium]|nr:4a-hydroxytetrahydrobiopterin dehydratase [bacterium]